MSWDVEFTDEFEAWWHNLTEDEQERLDAKIQLLEDLGPALGRPHVDTLTASRLPNLKELRSGPVRVLFVFDPRTTAILLLGGDKSGAWNAWYLTAIPTAEDLYDTHLDQLRREGLI